MDVGTDFEAHPKAGTVESYTDPMDREKIVLWPICEAEDHVEVQSATMGVLLVIQSNAAAEDNAAVFLTLDELERIAREGRRLHEERCGKVR